MARTVIPLPFHLPSLHLLLTGIKKEAITTSCCWGRPKSAPPGHISVSRETHAVLAFCTASHRSWDFCFSQLLTSQSVKTSFRVGRNFIGKFTPWVRLVIKCVPFAVSHSLVFLQNKNNARATTEVFKDLFDASYPFITVSLFILGGTELQQRSDFQQMQAPRPGH